MTSNWKAVKIFDKYWFSLKLHRWIHLIFIYDKRLSWYKLLPVPEFHFVPALMHIPTILEADGTPTLPEKTKQKNK